MESRSYCCCTIITPDYLPFALALNDSLRAQDPEVILWLLLTQPISDKAIRQLPNNVRFLLPEDLFDMPNGKAIFDRYFHEEMDHYRWSIKPVLLNYLLGKYRKAIYTDSDIFFYNKYNFILDYLKQYNVILTPHWRSSDPAVDTINFGKLFQEGIFNGGFIAARKEATPALKWWSTACLFQCKKEYINGYYVDQKYLDAMAVYHDKVYSLPHRGCNLADWNLSECRREIVNGEVLINRKWPVIFIHFSPGTGLKIMKGEDHLLRPHLEKYAEKLLQYGLPKERLDRIIPQLQTVKKQKPSRIKSHTTYSAKLKRKIYHFLFSK